MKDASAELLKGLRNALVTNGEVAAVVGVRVTSAWGLVQDAPFIRLHLVSAIPWEADGGGENGGGEHVINVHAWTDEPAPVQAATLADKIVRALADNDGIALTGADMWMLQWRGTTYRQDGDDPALQHAIISFSAYTTAE